MTIIGMCELCWTRQAIRHALVAWKSPVLPFGDVDRCEDEQSCRARIEAAGESWPILEREEQTA